jgi:hypothetical protein
LTGGWLAPLVDTCSSKVEPNLRNQDTITDSVFRLKRNPDPDHTTTLVESREIKNINGKPVPSQNMDGPALLSGAFEDGLAAVSLNQTACMSYALQRINRDRLPEPFIVRFATVLTPQNSADFFYERKARAEAVLCSVNSMLNQASITLTCCCLSASA